MTAVYLNVKNISNTITKPQKNTKITKTVYPFKITDTVGSFQF